jgi:S-adenosylmethionine hydrolase
MRPPPACRGGLRGLPRTEVVEVAGKLRGTVVSVSAGGDLVTDITAAQLEGVPTDESVSIHCDGHVTAGIFPVDHGQPEMTFLARLGESGCLELALVGDDASSFLGIRPGARVLIKW